MDPASLPPTSLQRQLWIRTRMCNHTGNHVMADDGMLAFQHGARRVRDWRLEIPEAPQWPGQLATCNHAKATQHADMRV